MQSEEYLALPVTQRPLPRVILEIKAVSISIATDILSMLLSLHPERIMIKITFSLSRYEYVEDAYFPERFQEHTPVDDTKVDGVWVESKWKALDDALAVLNYVGLQEVTIQHDLPREVMPDGYECEDELLKKMLPRVGASNVQLKSYRAPQFFTDEPSELCLYHRSAIHLFELPSCTADDLCTDREKENLDKEDLSKEDLREEDVDEEDIISTKE